MEIHKITQHLEKTNKISNADKILNVVTGISNLLVIGIYLTFDYSKKIAEILSISISGRHPSAKKIGEYRGKIEGFKGGINYIANHYEKQETQEKIKSFAKEAFEYLQITNPENLNYYLNYFGIQSKEAYQDFVILELNKAISNIERNAILGKWHHFKKIPHFHKGRLIAIGSLIKGYNYSGENAHILVRLMNDGDKPYAIQNTSIHEGEHFFQSSISGNHYKKEEFKNGAKLNRCGSPIFQLVFKKASETFKNINLPIWNEYKPIESQIDGIRRQFKSMVKTVLKPHMIGYYGDIREILARVREIQRLLGINGQHPFTKEDIRKLDGTNNKQRNDIKGNIISEEKFIDFMNWIY